MAIHNASKHIRGRVERSSEENSPRRTRDELAPENDGESDLGGQDSDIEGAKRDVPQGRRNEQCQRQGQLASKVLAGQKGQTQRDTCQATAHVHEASRLPTK